MKFFISLCLLLATVVLGEYQTTPLYPERNEADLVQDLMTNYKKVPRPVNHPTTPVIMSVGMTPLSINEVDEENQVVVIDTYIKMSWKDENLHWNPVQYQNISTVRLPSNDVWVPDLTLYSGTPQSSLFPPTETRVVVYSDGTVLWVPMFTLRSRCPMPRLVGEITCNVKMGSWTYDENLLYIQLSSPGLDLKNFIDNNHTWKLKSAVSSRESKMYPCCPDAYSALNFNFTLVRSRLNNLVNTMHLG